MEIVPAYRNQMTSIRSRISVTVYTPLSWLRMESTKYTQNILMRKLVRKRECQATVVQI